MWKKISYNDESIQNYKKAISKAIKAPQFAMKAITVLHTLEDNIKI